MPETENALPRRIVFVHGRKPKPPAEIYRSALWRCLLEGVRRARPAARDALAGHEDCFRLLRWSDLYYSSDRDFERDREAIDRLIEQGGATRADREEATSWQRRLKRMVYQVGDRYPWLVERFADEWIRATVADTRRYLEDHNGLGSAARQRVMRGLESTTADGARIMVLAHSLGSVIVYDALWELTHVHGRPLSVDWFITLGSPLGTRFIQRGLLGRDRAGAARYPAGIRHWCNFTARGDLAALDPHLYDDFEPMLELGLLESLDDSPGDIFGSFRNAAGLNVHRSYGYLVQPAVGRIVAEWFRDGRA